MDPAKSVSYLIVTLTDHVITASTCGLIMAYYPVIPGKIKNPGYEAKLTGLLG